MIVNQVKIDGIFVVVRSTVDEEIYRFITDVNVRLFITQKGNFSNVTSGLYEYECMKITPFGVISVGKFKSNYGKIDFNYKVKEK